MENCRAIAGSVLLLLGAFATFIAVVQQHSDRSDVTTNLNANAGYGYGYEATPAPTSPPKKHTDSSQGTLQKVSAGGACVMNNAWFVMKYKLVNLNTGHASAWSNEFGAFRNTCMMAEDVLPGVSEGDLIQVVSKAEAGAKKDSELVIEYDPNTVNVLNYDCTGTTYFYACHQGKGDTVANITQAVTGFAEGFAEGLGDALGVQQCLSGLETAYSTTTSVASSLAQGIDTKSSEDILDAFKAAGTLLHAYVEAFRECKQVEEETADGIKTVAGLLTANPASIIKTVVGDSIQIFGSSTELTADCKTMAADWKNTDYSGAGEALGEIVGTLIKDVA